MISNIEDYDQTFNIPRTIFKFIGLRLLRPDTTRIRICCLLLYGLELFLMVSGVMQELIYMVQVGRSGSLQLSLDILMMVPCVGYVILALAKSYKMVACRSLYENMFRELRALWPRGLLDHDEHRLVHSSLKELNFIIRCSYMCNCLMWFIFVSSPLVGLAQRWAGQDVPKTLPLYFWFPFDPWQPIVYEVILAIQTWSTLPALLLLVVADMLYWLSLSHLSSLLRLLALRIRKLANVPVDDQLPLCYPLGEMSERLEANDEVAVFGARADWERQYSLQFAEVIERHRILIRLVGDVESLNGFQLLLTFCNSSVVICACGFCSVIVEKLTELTYKSFLAAALTEMWLICWFGQKIIDSSQDVAESLYNSGWYNASKKIRSTILTMILRSQKELHITTYGFSVVCLSSFATIVKTSWSYFTLLLNMYKE